LLSIAAAGELLDGFAKGWVDAAEVMAAPLLLVDAASNGDPGQLEVPDHLPAVVAAVCPAGAPALSRRGPDVALTGVADPPRPWVSQSSLDRAVGDLAARVASAPGAALALVAALRAGRVRSVEAGHRLESGLLLESLAYSMLQAGPEFALWRSTRPPSSVRPDDSPAILVRRAGSRMEITLNRPQVHNAYNRRMRDELCEALSAALSDPDCTVHLSGAGPSFCSGGDLDEFGTAPDPVTAHVVRTGRSPARLLAALSSRTEVVLHGSCAGSGLELPAFAGTIRARPGTSMWLPELAMGLIPGAGGTVSVARRIGARRTAWMALSGRPVDATTALRWGLVDEVLGERE
jgi:enoyl-CoA hydratase/carnithine racemase